MSFLRKLLGQDVSDVAKGPRCDSCNSFLRITVTSKNSVSVYAGALCTVCGKTECDVCKKKKGQLQSPCSWCGGKVTGVIG